MLFTNVLMQGRPNGGGAGRERVRHGGLGVQRRSESARMWSVRGPPCPAEESTAGSRVTRRSPVSGNAINLVQAYNGGTNVTTFHFDTSDQGSGIIQVNTSGGSGGSPDMELQKPTAPDALTSYAFGTTTDPLMRTNLRTVYTTLRFQVLTSSMVDLSDRTPPKFAFQLTGSDTTIDPLFPFQPPTTSSNGISIEGLITILNECGCDGQLSIPVRLSDAAMLGIGQIFKYGSDGSGTPYTSVQASPVNPPLLSHLKITLEIGNETPWNQANAFYLSYWYSQKLADAEKTAPTPMGALLSSDGNVRVRQWVLGRLMQHSNNLRLNLPGEPEWADRLLLRVAIRELQQHRQRPDQLGE